MAKSKSTTNKDGLGSGILPANRGASGGKGLPPRVHAVHCCLYRSSSPLSLKEIEDQLATWGYVSKTQAVTKNHIFHLMVGWEPADDLKAVVEKNNRYELTIEARKRLSRGGFFPFP